MANVGKVRTLFTDKTQSEILYPKTKIKAISDDNGVGLESFLDKIIIAGEATDEVASIPRDADTLGGKPASDFALAKTTTMLNNKIDNLTYYLRVDNNYTITNPVDDWDTLMSEVVHGEKQIICILGDVIEWSDTSHQIYYLCGIEPADRYLLFANNYNDKLSIANGKCTFIARPGQEVVGGTYGQGYSTGAIPRITVDENGNITNITTQNLYTASSKSNGLMPYDMYSYIYYGEHAATSLYRGTFQGGSMEVPFTITLNNCKCYTSSGPSVATNVYFPRIYNCYLSLDGRTWEKIEPSHMEAVPNGPGVSSVQIGFDLASQNWESGQTYAIIILYERNYAVTSGH